MKDLLSFLCTYSDLIQALSLVISLAAICFAIIIPRQILMNQLYSDLVREYRSAEMGAAIFLIFHFYVTVCKNNVSFIADEYKKKYEEQIKIPLALGKQIDYDATLHFQRRLVAQFYADMATLRYKRRFPWFPAKYLKEWFTPSEAKLLAILLHMAGPARAVFEEARNLSEPPEDEVFMNRQISKLYEEVRYME
ncbi:MAG: hypothetical protein LBP29_06375 [Treponema sp.]|nr:hypothetical protein [Treponema sp.]